MNPLELFSDELEKLVERAAPSVVALEHRRGQARSSGGCRVVMGPRSMG